ncbi:hypothetical protein [Pontimicrobium sp. MEBiC01747]
MNIGENSYIQGEGVYYQGVLRDVRKSKISLQPVYEGFTNAFESIRIKRKEIKDFKGEISIKIYSTQNTDETLTFSKLQIRDNGIGFNELEFKRFNTYKDFTKGFKNLGSGRIQFAHHFDKTNFTSVYLTDERKTRKRKFTVSKSQAFIDNNSITFHESDIEIPAENTGTVVTFNGLLDPSSNIYHALDHIKLKESLLQKYIQYFCLNKESLPEIKIEHFLFEESQGISSIDMSDIPEIDKTQNIFLNYSRLSDNANDIEKTDKTEEFTINAFKMHKSTLKENSIKFTSKNEVIEQIEIDLDLLSKDEVIENNHFLFLVSGDYFDNKDSNERGELNIPDLEQFSKNINLFEEEEIILDDLKLQINDSILSLYPEIKKVKEEHENNYQKLKEMFLLDDNDEGSIKISVNDSEKKILEKFYSAEAKRKANIDANIKNSIDRLNSLDTTSEDYINALESEIEKITKVIPLQNKTDLTHYVARRKLVLELFSKIIDKKLLVQNDGSRNKDEALLHNLIFQQNSSSPEISDLWLINEDFIYFKGTSESTLSDVKIDGEKLIKETLSDEEEEFRVSLGENRLGKRPDILLFPMESKCIILEFKNPDISVSDHLNQINNYATLLRNYTNDKFKIVTFYGYLIGEKISPNDVRAHDADFIHAYNFDYLFRPAKKIAGMFKNQNQDGNLYTEVIKYSTLLSRAKMRNKVFIDKLLKNPESIIDDED